MLHVALWEPQIPPNTGNIARLCAATGARLHLIGKLGFRIDEAAVRRAGLDYWPHVDLVQHATWNDFTASVSGGIWLIDNPAPLRYTEAAFRDGDALVFGGEKKGLPEELRAEFATRLLAIPMPTGKVRSLNLGTAAGIALYEAYRQIGIA